MGVGGQVIILPTLGLLVAQNSVIIKFSVLTAPFSNTSHDFLTLLNFRVFNLYSSPITLGSHPGYTWNSHWYGLPNLPDTPTFPLWDCLYSFPLPVWDRNSTCSTSFFNLHIFFLALLQFPETQVNFLLEVPLPLEDLTVEVNFFLLLLLKVQGGTASSLFLDASSRPLFHHHCLKISLPLKLMTSDGYSPLPILTWSICFQDYTFIFFIFFIILFFWLVGIFSLRDFIVHIAVIEQSSFSFDTNDLHCHDPRASLKYDSTCNLEIPWSWLDGRWYTPSFHYVLYPLSLSMSPLPFFLFRACSSLSSDPLSPSLFTPYFSLFYVSLLML